MSRTICSLEDMQEACRKLLLRYSEGLTFDQFVENERTHDAVITIL